MPIYEYTCTSCGHRTDILHGINDPIPPFCPECGAEGTLRKAFAPPAIVFKGSGWAKKDRAAARRSGPSADRAADSGDGKDAAAADKSGAASGSTGSTGATGSGESSGAGASSSAPTGSKGSASD